MKIDNEIIRKLDHADFGKKTWIPADMMSNTWVTTCPKEHIALNARQFPVVARTYFVTAIVTPYATLVRTE